MNGVTQWARLHEVVRRESRSLLQYQSKAFPWAKAGDQAAADQVLQLAREQNEAAGQLARLLARRRHPVPFLGAFPTSFTTANFVSLRYELPRLAADEKRAADLLEADWAALTDPEARTLVGTLLAQKRLRVKTLEQLAASHQAISAA
jgi:hypothetical protein